MIIRMRECEKDNIKLDKLLCLSMEMLHGQWYLILRMPHSSLDVIIVVPLFKSEIKLVTGVCEGIVGCCGCYETCWLGVLIPVRFSK